MALKAQHLTGMLTMGKMAASMYSYKDHMYLHIL